MLFSRRFLKSGNLPLLLLLYLRPHSIKAVILLMIAKQVTCLLILTLVSILWNAI